MMKVASKKISIAIIVVLACVIGFFAFRALWDLYKLGEVDSAIGRMRALSTAEVHFVRTHPDLGYTCTLSDLAPNDAVTRLMAQRGRDNGYVFELLGCQVPSQGKPNSMYYTTARPLQSGQ